MLHFVTLGDFVKESTYGITKAILSIGLMLVCVLDFVYVIQSYLDNRKETKVPFLYFLIMILLLAIFIISIINMFNNEVETLSNDNISTSKTLSNNLLWISASIIIITMTIFFSIRIGLIGLDSKSNGGSTMNDIANSIDNLTYAVEATLLNQYLKEIFSISIVSFLNCLIDVNHK